MPKRKLAREAAQAAVDGAAATAQPAWHGRHPDGSKSILVRVPAETWKAFKFIALDEERTLQSVVTGALDDYLHKRRID